MTKKRQNNQREIRISQKSERLEIRKNADGSRTLEGWAVVWGAISEDLGFRERIQRGAFAQSLKENPDVLMYWGHDSNAIVARVSNGSLSMDEDAKGLHFRATVYPQISTSKDLIAMLEQQLVTGMSFGFSVPDGGDDWSTLPNGEVLRTVTTALLWEISAVGTPAYKASSVNLRSCPADLRAKLNRSDDDDDLDDEDDDDDCDCDCLECEEGRCEECSEERCDSASCDGCPYQAERARQVDLLLRRMRS